MDSHLSRAFSFSQSVSASTSPSSSMESLMGIILPQLLESETDLDFVIKGKYSCPNAELSRNYPQTQHRRVYTSDEYIQIGVGASVDVDSKTTKTKITNPKPKTKRSKKRHKKSQTKRKTKHKRHRGSKKAVIRCMDITQIRRIIHVDIDIDREVRLSASITRHGTKIEIHLMTENLGNRTISGVVMKWYRGEGQKKKKITLAKAIKGNSYARRIFCVYQDTDSYDSEKGIEVRIEYELQRLDDWLDIENIYRKSNKFYLLLD